MAQRAASPSPAPRSRLSPRGARTRQALVAAAREIFNADGFLDARITDITARAGVAAGSFYTYFTSKEEVFAAVIEQLGEEMLHPRLHEEPDRDDPIAVIEAANRAYLVAYRRDAKLMASLEQVALLDAEFRRLRLSRTRAFIARNARAIAELQRRGRADPDLDPQLAAAAMSAMVSRMAYMTFVQGVNRTSTEVLVATLTRLWAGALGIATTPPRAAAARSQTSRR